MNSTDGQFCFGPFLLDPVERRLLRGEQTVEVSGRYFDALALLVREQGKLVSKDRLHEEVWRGIPVTDEAITQCMRSLRRELGDDASAPTFIETVPRHGYRFIAPVVSPTDPLHGPHEVDHAVGKRVKSVDGAREHALRVGMAGIAGGALAGLLGGLFYGFVIASDAIVGGASTVLVLMSITLLVAVVGAAGVTFGMATARVASHGNAAWTVAGGALGGALVGGFVKLVAVDTLALVFGGAPRGITGGAEGLAVGGAVALGVVLASRPGTSLRKGAALSAAVGGLACALVALAGGRLMGGSLALLAEAAPGSRLDLDPLGFLAGQDDFGAAAQMVSAGLEGALFAGFIAAAMLWAERQDAPERQLGVLGPGAS